jgi:hypothetical protein
MTKRYRLAAAVGSVLLLLGAAPPPTKTVVIEFLQGSIAPKNIGDLAGLACRNYDRIVHLDISVNWPAKDADVETIDEQRLIFWNSRAEYLFPKDSYQYLHGEYVIKGYFIARNGGIHQGATSRAFDRVDDATVMVSPTVTERKAGGKSCK